MQSLQFYILLFLCVGLLVATIVLFIIAGNNESEQGRFGLYFLAGVCLLFGIVAGVFAYANYTVSEFISSARTSLRNKPKNRVSLFPGAKFGAYKNKFDENESYNAGLIGRDNEYEPVAPKIVRQKYNPYGSIESYSY